MNYRRMLLALFLLCGVGQLFGQNKKDHYVLFASNSSEVTSDEVNSLLEVLSEQAYVRNIRLNAFTDADGSDEFNLALSKRRLESVRAVLLENGYEVKDEGFYGEAKPVASNEIENGKQKNRRVHIQFEYDTKLITLESILETVKPASQGFCIDNTKDTAIVCRKGTIIGIPAGAFASAACSDCIELKIDEMLDVRDMIVNNAHTQSDGQMLSSGGTLFIEATCNGKKLSGNTEQPITYMFPTNNPQDDMTCWTSSGAQGDLNWHERTEAKFSPIYADLLGGDGLNRTLMTSQGEAYVRCGFFCKIAKPFGFDFSRTYTRRGKSWYAYNYPSEVMAITDPASRRAAMTQIDKNRTQARAYFTGQINQMNNINCDAFPGEKVEPIIVNSSEEGDCIVKLAYPSVNGVMSSPVVDGKAQFYGSSERKAMVVAIKVVDNESYLAVADKEELATSVDLAFEKMSPVQIRERLKRLKM